jgi:hypothetical protein
MTHVKWVKQLSSYLIWFAPEVLLTNFVAGEIGHITLFMAGVRKRTLF